ncbi:Lrp/AsnC family transcriptional regulator [Gulosibacter molinativorax]|uniref:Lrp/AsnC family transcriptional regulator n=1 Tax=Gulosibacter molinativorax TaxID=256821 RepID=A0ABT7CAI4_9MICO|nr:Lrp/AsnC family transcriptional regulator [Gulosibacter molinativorax]MDJ1371656.1 Lrp/AsnC family transcriptional regulator [Gulosibacter molinativorax]QUY60999.1 Hypotetical protein [Gulosibacter molinativorax]
MPESRTELDDRLIAALKIEPRATVLSLAQSTGFPRAVVATRLKDLQESNDLRIVGATHPELSNTQTVAVVSISVQGPIAPVPRCLMSICPRNDLHASLVNAREIVPNPGQGFAGTG